MSGLTFQQVSLVRLIAKLAVAWIALLVLPFAERTLLGAKTYYFLYIGLGLVFVLYGLTIRSVFSFLQHARREPVYVWIAYIKLTGDFDNAIASIRIGDCFPFRVFAKNS
jgi:hypothetical protein